MKKIYLYILLGLIGSYSSVQADEKGCLPEFNKIELNANSANEGGDMYICVYSYPKVVKYLTPNPHFQLKKMEAERNIPNGANRAEVFGFTAKIEGIHKNYMCRSLAGNRERGHSLMFKISDLPTERFENRDIRAHWEREEGRFGGRRNPYRIVAYMCGSGG